MHGFSILLSTKNDTREHKFSWKAPLHFQQELVLRNYNSNSMLVEQYTGKKFLTEKLWIDSPEFFIVTEGVISNLRALSEQFWYDNNPEIKKELDSYFSNHIHLLSSEKELLEDCKALYSGGNINEKTQVLTLLAAYKLLF